MGSELRVFYHPQQTAKAERLFSPSARKPAEVLKSWKKRRLPMKVIGDFEPATKRDFYLAHDLQMVDDILACRAPNGFGTMDEEIARSLPWTTGSMIAATLDALKHGGITASLTSGFHHASFNRAAAFCTFNGLAIAAMRARLAGANKVGVLDFDGHLGNGTDDIIAHFGLDWNEHYTLGGNPIVADERKSRFGLGAFEETYGLPGSGRSITASRFLADLPKMMKRRFADCDVLLYQAGADSWVEDPLGGGVFDKAQMRQRDRIVFRQAMRLGLPTAWCLAGGYAEPLRKVLDLHDATAQEAVAALKEVGPASSRSRSVPKKLEQKVRGRRAPSGRGFVVRHRQRDELSIPVDILAIKSRTLRLVSLLRGT